MPAPPQGAGPPPNTGPPQTRAPPNAGHLTRQRNKPPAIRDGPTPNAGNLTRQRNKPPAITDSAAALPPRGCRRAAVGRRPQRSYFVLDVEEFWELPDVCTRGAKGSRAWLAY